MIIFNYIILVISYSFSIEILITNGIYNLIYKNGYFNYENQTISISEYLKDTLNSYFRITHIANYSSGFYYIEHINTNLSLISYHNNNILNISDRKEEFSASAFWIFIQTENNNFRIQNENKCFLKIRNFNITCENINLEEASIFSLIKIYEEVVENSIYNKIIEKEPIDVLIKYIDLRDPFLKRDGIHQIEKDFDNEELRYSIRSILKYIPWVRKIFILMPNEKVRYFNDSQFIKERIVYVKDKDILGYDSSNSLAFQFRYWKLEKFGISDNFIAMDDDCFIGQPLNKTDFFYILDNKVVPSIITYKFLEIDKKAAKKKIIHFKKIINRKIQEQTSSTFKYSLYLTYSFLLELFNQTKYFPIHTHNAIPVNLKELKEVYDLVYQSEYKSCTLDSLYRSNDNLQFQVLILSYTFIKYKKKVRNISNKLIQSRYAIFEDYNFSLFCINTGAIKYTPLSFIESKIVMEYLFPNPSPYEISSNNLPTLTLNALFLIEKEFYQYKIKNNGFIKPLKEEVIFYKKLRKIYLIVILLFFIFYLFIMFATRRRKKSLLLILGITNNKKAIYAKI